ncbi:hypothetical protein G6011_06503 [Alternaria panax]|uniref:Uncharacterized protein n=1 Tax=Alternaria panax TaxID=48097 RepID=A0AAD4FHT8_9PLEO|nr:hypothetical protein G6011_06503 [Alternaria panax]
MMIYAAATAVKQPFSVYLATRYVLAAALGATTLLANFLPSLIWQNHPNLVIPRPRAQQPHDMDKPPSTTTDNAFYNHSSVTKPGHLNIDPASSKLFPSLLADSSTMARSIILFTGTLLTILSPLAQAKEKNELRTYAFTSDDCSGTTQRGNMDLKMGKCQDIVIGANSIKPFHNKHEAWIGRINDGGPPCFISTFQHHGCKGPPTSTEELPQAISECISPAHEEPFLSVLFECHEIPPPISIPNPYIVTETTYLTNSEWVHTSNTLIPLLSSTVAIYTMPPIPTVTVVGSTVTMLAPSYVPVQTVTILPPSTKTVTVYHDYYDRSRMRRSDPQQEIVDKDSQDLEPRGKNKWKGPRIGVWMLHPWTAAVICYECYTKSPDNLLKFECRSGPKNPVDCKGPVPDPQETITITHTPAVTVTAGDPVTSIVTVTAPRPRPVTSPAITGQAIYTMVGGKPVFTIINQTTQAVTFGQKDGDLEPRKSFHRAVKFHHPFYPETEMCADGEWDGRGKDRGEIRIQKPSTDMKRCVKDYEVQHIDAFPQTTTYELPTRTIAISTSTVYPPSIITVDPSPPLVTITTIVGSAPAPPLVTVTTIIDPAPSATTITTIFDTAPPYSTITTIFDAEPACSTVTVLPGVAPTSYTTIYQDRRRHRDL